MRKNNKSLVNARIVSADTDIMARMINIILGSSDYGTPSKLFVSFPKKRHLTIVRSVFIIVIRTVMAVDLREKKKKKK